MQAQGGGLIVNVAWDQALTGGVGTESGQLFAAAKAGIVGFSKALARAWRLRAGQRAGARWIRPRGRDRRPRTLRAPAPGDTFGALGYPKTWQAQRSFLASDAAFLTGQVLMVNGGVVM